MRDQPGPDPGGASCSESGMLSDLLHSFDLSAGKGRTDRSDTVIIDAKSGTSGAGSGAKVDNLFCEVNENIKAYGVASHRHTPEIEDQLGYACHKEVRISFTPHLVPMNRGILVTGLCNSSNRDGRRAAAYDAIMIRRPLSGC